MEYQLDRGVNLRPEVHMEPLSASEVDENMHCDPATIRRYTAHSMYYPLSFNQERVWILDQLLTQQAFHNVSIKIHFEGQLNLQVLEQSLNEVVRRHDILRTTFATVDGQPAQASTATLSVSITRLDKQSLSAEDARSANVEEILRAEAQHPFESHAQPMLRATLVCTHNLQHDLLLTMHQLICDSWSMDLLLRELLTHYNALLLEQPPALPELSIQYADFAAWQREYLSGESLAALQAYWQAHLAHAPTLLELPADYPRPVMPALSGARTEFSLAAPLVEECTALCQQANVTLEMLLLAIFQILLYRYTDQPDLVVGLHVSGRQRPETQMLIGNFGTLLPLRATVQDTISFREYLGQVRASVLSGFAHQDLPLEQMLSVLQLERTLNHTPLFQHVFSFQETITDLPEINGLRIAVHGYDSDEIQYDLMLSVTKTPTGLRGVCKYSTELFAEATVQRMVDHFETLVAGVLANPDQRLSRLPLLTEAEHRQFALWNSTARQYRQDACLHTLFEAQAERTPTAIALAYNDTLLSYAQLNNRANQLAHHLRSLGVGRHHDHRDRSESLVGLCAERSIEMVVGLLGILKAGAAYVPLDPDYPADRLQFMLDDARVPVLLIQEHLLADFPAHNAQTLCLDRDWSIISAAPTTAPPTEVTADQAAYLIYTSGSTGRPKGVLNIHSAVCNRLQWMCATYQLTPDDRLLQKTPFSFDVSVWEFFWPLITGARLVLAQPGGHRDPDYLMHVIQQERITTLHFVPSMLDLFLEAVGDQEYPSVRQIFCSGEALSFTLQERCFKLLPDVALHNLYGPTEAAIEVTFWACERNNVRQVVPIGRPVANTRIHLLDRAGQPVPVGVPGELLIGGSQLARGYLNRPALTAERFVPDLFGAEPGARLYRTGDLARYLADGTIEYLGRLDFQVKLRGFRIELGEIEAVLRQHAAVQQAVVVAQVYGPADTRLHGYIVPTPGLDETIWRAEVLAFLRTRLPDYMVPTALVSLPALPLTASGKIDRVRLPVPGDTTTPVAAYVAPRSRREERVATIWTQVLKRPQISVHDNFFDLGGNSLLAIQVISSVKRSFKVQLDLRCMFEGPTVARITDAIEQALLTRLDQDELAQLLEGMRRENNG